MLSAAYARRGRKAQRRRTTRVVRRDTFPAEAGAFDDLSAGAMLFDGGRVVTVSGPANEESAIEIEILVVTPSVSVVIFPPVVADTATRGIRQWLN